MVSDINREELVSIMANNKERVYEAFFNSKEDKLYYNQLKEITGFSHSSLQNVIDKLKKGKEITEEKTKSNTYYSLTDKNKPIEFARISLSLIENLNIDVRISLKKFILNVPKSVFSILFFGSASVKKESENSDIDLLVVFEKFEDSELQKLYEKEIKKKMNLVKEEVDVISVYPISLTFVSFDDFVQGDDFLVKEAKQKGFPVVNMLNYYSEK